MTASALDHPAPAPTGPAAGPAQAKRTFKLSRRARKLTLAIHVITAVGWVGLSLSMMVLAIMGWFTRDAAIAKGVYWSMYVFDETSVTVFSITAAITGILLSTGTPWGLLLHWWIIVKWAITLFMTVFAWFVIHPIVITASKNTADVGDGPPEPGWPADFLLWSVPVLFVMLTVAATVSVYKPWGRTARGRRKSGGARRRSTPAQENRPVTVESVDHIATDVADLRLAMPDGSPVPAWEAGAHIDLVLPSGLVRQYSLHGDPADRSAYRVAVLREPEGRGGSVEVHALTAGQTVAVRGPRNNFPLAEGNSHLFIAGGIGVTPFLPMIKEAERRGARWRLVYVGRSRQAMAFLGELERYGRDKVSVYARDVTARPDLVGFLSTSPQGTAVYCCGPAALMDGVQELMPTACPDGKLHLERFSSGAAAWDPADNEPFEVELRDTGEVVPVAAAESMLDAMRQVAPGLPASCEDGVCGSCEVRLVRGVPEHRDDVLDPDERERTDVMYPCVSRARSKRLVVDM